MTQTEMYGRGNVLNRIHVMFSHVRDVFLFLFICHFETICNTDVMWSQMCFLEYVAQPIVIKEWNWPIYKKQVKGLVQQTTKCISHLMLNL